MDILPVPERRKLIQRLVDASSRTEYVPYRDSYASFPVVELPLSTPLYRAANGRLAVVLSEHVKHHQLPSDYFEQGEASPEIQSLLHEFLRKMSQDEHAPIWNELQRTALQTEPILITADGIVVNGNRRLAAMRELFQQDSERFHRYAKVIATVLPQDATPADLEMVEAALQMAPETKLAYGWIDRRMKLRRHRDVIKLPVQRICEGYRITDPEQIDREIEELALAEEYLAEFLGSPFEYHLLADDEEAFVQLAKQLSAVGERLRQAWRLIGFCLIKESKVLEFDPLQYFPFTAPRPVYAPQIVLIRFGAEQDLWPTVPDEQSEQSLGGHEFRLLNDLLARAELSNQHAAAIIGLSNQVFEEHKLGASPLRILRMMKQLNKIMLRLDVANFSEKQRREFQGHLKELEFYASTLSDQERSKESNFRRFKKWISGQK